MAAGDAIIVGIQDMTEQGIRETKEAGEVSRFTRRWEGPSDKVDITLATLALTGSGIAAIDGRAPDGQNVERGSGVAPAVVEAFWNTDPAPEGIVTWELLSQKLIKPLSTHSMFYNLGTATLAGLAAIDDAVRRGTAANTDFAYEYGWPTLNKYRDYRLLGIDTYQEWSYVLKKTTRISNASSVKLTGGVPPNTVVNWASIQVPETSKFTQPTGRRLTASESPTWEDFYFDEWLTEAPSITYQHGKKVWTISQDWLGAEKWADFYQGGTYIP